MSSDPKLLPLEKMKPGEILDSARNLERLDYVARRNYRLEDQRAWNSPVNIAILPNQSQD